MVAPKLNRRVRIQVIGAPVNDQGGITPGGEIVNYWDKWAQVEDRSGSNSNPYQQQIWTYDYKITMRAERTRPTQSNYEILYNGGTLKIESVSLVTENFIHYEVCRCSKIDQQVTVPG